ncbi:metal-dependent transcriptional regulator [Corynebacterium mayonis]|uniref:metal-dependent transcriptional regulator n=1 Tax=Corynebacterium mayonis TaxID=3062461 RepID=UPI00314004F3
MDVSSLPAKTQDYLKIIFDLTERSGMSAAMGEIAERMGQRPSTTTEGIKRLAEKGLVNHEPYGDISLTEAGRAIAMVMARRHRLLETYLVEMLGYRWDEVHEEADNLEHAVSDTFIARIDALLGHPTRDPHGDPIPNEKGEVDVLQVQSLASLAQGASGTVERIHDSDSELLRYLAEMGIRPGVSVTMTGTRFAGMRLVRAGEKEVALADAAVASIDITTH